MSFETISLLGIPSAAVFACCKKKVIGVDVNQKTAGTINRGADLAVKQSNTGHAFQVETGLQEIMKAHTQCALHLKFAGRISRRRNPASALKEYFVGVYHPAALALQHDGER